MALIVGDDFQHILRVLNTNVDGREKVRRRFRFFTVREWAFGVRIRSSSSNSKSFSGGGEALLGSCGSLWVRSRSRRVGKMERDSRARRFLARWEYLRARMRLVRALWMLATRGEAAQKAMSSFFRFFLKTHTKKGERPDAGRVVFLEQNVLFTHHATNANSFLVTQQVMYSLTKIKGIGRRFANIICKKGENRYG